METKVDKTNTLAMRISKIRGHFCYGNNLEFSEKLGLTRTYASSICSGGKIPGKETLEKILESFPEVNKSWLYFGEGQMLRSPSSIPGIVEQNTIQAQELEMAKDELIASLKNQLADKERTIVTLQAYVERLEKTLHDYED